MASHSHPDERIVAAEPTESGAELAWLSDHANELEREYTGEWLLISGRQLLCHSPDFAEIRSKIEQMQLQSPFLYFVPKPTNGDFIA